MMVRNWRQVVRDTSVIAGKEAGGGSGDVIPENDPEGFIKKQIRKLENDHVSRDKYYDYPPVSTGRRDYSPLLLLLFFLVGRHFVVFGPGQVVWDVALAVLSRLVMGVGILVVVVGPRTA